MAEIAFVIGTRAELIKSFPVIKSLKEVDVLATGQHNLDFYSDLFGIDIMYLTDPPGKSSRFMGKTARAAAWAGLLIPRLAKAIEPYEKVVYHGDTMSTVAAAISAWLKKKTGIHIEAGLRSFSLMEPFPEEISRVISDRLSDVLFSVSKTATENLRSERVKGKVIQAGNTIVDSATIAKGMFRKKVDAPREFGVVTVHRHENIKSRERMKKIVKIISSVNIPLLFFMHDNTRKFLKKYRLLDGIIHSENVEIRKLGAYPEFINYLSKAKIIFTDGGSVQEESLIFKKPCFLLRMYTERIDGLKTGINFLTKLNVEWTLKKAGEVLDGFEPPRFKNPYGEKGVSKKIAEHIESFSC